MKEAISRPQLTRAHKKRIYLAALLLAAAFVGLVTWFVGRPMVRFVSEPERFRAWVDASGLWGRVAFVGMVIFQLVIAIIPGEPLEIGAGYAFGAVEGTLLCLLGIVLGSAMVFLLVRRFGMRVVEVFFSTEKIRGARFLHNSRRLKTVTFIVFFIPGTPKDLMSYFIGLTDMRLRDWLLITGVARIPSVVTSTVAGDALGLEQYTFALVVFVGTLLVSLAGLAVYRRIASRRPSKS